MSVDTPEEMRAQANRAADELIAASGYITGYNSKTVRHLVTLGYLQGYAEGHQAATEYARTVVRGDAA